MKEQYRREPREIHYELVPRCKHGRKKISTCKLLFATVVGVFIIALIAFFLLLLFAIYLRPTPPPSHIPGKDLPPTTVKAPTEKRGGSGRTATARGRRGIQVFVIFRRENLMRAEEVRSQLAALLFQGGDEKHHVEVSVLTLSSENSSNVTLKVAIHERTLIKAGFVAIFVSELMTPIAAQIEKMIEEDQRTCTKLDVARCVEICSVATDRNALMTGLTPAEVLYDSLSVEIPNLVEVAQDSPVYRQLTSDLFSLTRRSRACIVDSGK